MKLLVAIFLLIAPASFSQSADFILLKKKGKTIRPYYAGRNIAFISNTGAAMDAYINQIKNDTLYLEEFIIRQAVTKFGFYIIDTAGSFHYKFHYNQIAALGHKAPKGFNVNGSGAALFGGGILLTLASTAVLIADHKKFSPALMIAGAGLGGLGYLLGKSGGKPMALGKKYRLVYMKMSAAEKN